MSVLKTEVKSRIRGTVPLGFTALFLESLRNHGIELKELYININKINLAFDRGDNRMLEALQTCFMVCVKGTVARDFLSQFCSWFHSI
jgi:hypothetical protein